MKTFIHANCKQTLFSKPEAPLNLFCENNSFNMFKSYNDPQKYAEILLHEYKALVEVLSHCDEKSFQAVHEEVNKVVDKLLKWFDNTSPEYTLSIYFSMRHLKQKIKKHKIEKQWEVEPDQPKSEEMPAYTDYLMKRWF